MSKNTAHLTIFLVFISILNVILSLTATLGNGIVLVAILRTQNLRTPSYLLIASLASTDLLVGLVYHPFQAVQCTFYLQNKVAEICGKFMEFMVILYFICAVAFLTIACISIDRYLALRLKHRYRVVVTKKRVYVLIAISWSVAFAGAPLVTVLHVFLLQYELANILVMSAGAICLTTTCTFYIMSFRTLRLYTAQIHAQQPNSLQPNFNVVQYKKSLKTMLFTFVAFLLSLVPPMCFVLAAVLFNLGTGIFFFYSMSATLVAVNSSVNPIIYFIRFKDIRNACKQMLWKVKHWMLAHQSSNGHVSFK